MGEITTTVCAWCGREMLSKDGLRGRPKEAHDNCREARTRWNQFTTAMQNIDFTPEKAKIMKGELFNLRNTGVRTLQDANPRLALDGHPSASDEDEPSVFDMP